MSFPSNILQAVATYNRSELPLLSNYNGGIFYSNKKFQNFQNLTGNLGSSVTYDTPPRFITTDGLVAVWQAANQLVQTITVDQAANTSMAFTNQDRIFNVEKPMSGEDYVKTFGRSAIAEFGAKVEKNILQNFTSSVVSQTTGVRNVTSGPFRFFGTGLNANPINTYTQLIQAGVNYTNFGNPGGELLMFIPDVVEPSIINSGLSQFTLDRGNRDANSWEIGKVGNIKVIKSNLLPLHTAGTVGDTASPGNELTLVSVNDPTGANVTQMTFSGAGTSDANAIKAGDLAKFIAVSGKPDLYYRTYVGHQQSSQSVQFKITADAASDSSGNVTVSIYPALSWITGPNQNLNVALQAGMKIRVMASHRAGCIIGADALYLAMPRMPVTDPYNSSSEMDPTTGVSMQLTYGTVFGQNQYGFIRQAVWGSFLDPLYCMRMLFPVSQGQSDT